MDDPLNAPAKVWLLESSHEQYEPFYIEGVYSSLEKAQASVAGAVWLDRDRNLGMAWLGFVDAADSEWDESAMYRITEKEVLP
ncbi:hypothetical protein [Rhodococcoides fascians]|uniref:hypothetical protein n=1 Tax=Rhodococcoides fascians TaxID=1828 RepID=UPI00050CBFEC|nr:hypothetical protein [Rhodococcus fascians]